MPQSTDRSVLGEPSSNNTPFKASDYANDGKQHLLLAASGSVATIKIVNIIAGLSHHPNLAICLILTKSAAGFLAGQSAEQPHFESLRAYKNVEKIFFDEDEWIHPWKRGQPILHIELRRWATLLAIVPLSANTLAKITGGFSDNLLTSVVRAWDTTGEIEAAQATLDGEVQARKEKKRILVAPAMNTAMWRQPITKKQLAILEDEWGVSANDGSPNESKGWFEVLAPQEKELACGDVGDGALKDWREIVKVMEQRLHLDV
jgi:phosphopantothenoylcysteine decarboxylase